MSMDGGYAEQNEAQKSKGRNKLRLCMSGDGLLQYLKDDKKGSTFSFNCPFLGVVDERDRVNRGIEGAVDSRNNHTY